MAFTVTDVKEIFGRMAEAFNPDAAEGLDAVIQYEITGDNGGRWQVAIKDGTCEVKEGTHESPTVTLKMSDETFIGLLNKEVDNIQAFMSGQLNVSGDMMLAQLIEQLFPSP